MKKTAKRYHVRDIRTSIWCVRCRDRPAVKEVISHRGERTHFCNPCYEEFRQQSPDCEFREKQK